ncbi:hypothetical protein [Roseomonas marmotae]|uniref:Glycosyltransferase RgtA/B/C/D-like domain-containing protein n=1 Tax=Roseomonas marmotae TaxID=2768161 RepID=A0ABS3K9Q4_9PROT|nr:hypothetical protein [Roseomonas marmotae]MBO1074186.1 hypothetical protein [Roseomonas marmotae]QTI78959.1 hypothetical protein IAI58_15135 [Roseomonas marmotae]
MTETPSLSTARGSGLLSALPALLPALLFLALIISPPMNQDVAAVLSFSQRMLAGEVLYTDLIDVNPPLIFLLNLPAAALAAWTPLDGVQALLVLLLAFCVLVGWLCLRLNPPRGTAEAAMMLALLPLVLLLAGYDFGQREQIMAAAALPYLFLAERRIEGARPGIRGVGPVVAPPGLRWRPSSVVPGPLMVAGCTVLAATGFALKPHFLIVPAMVEALVLLASGRRRGWAAAFLDPVPWGMAALWLGYLALILLGFPAYFGQVVPLVRDYYLGLGGASWWQVLLTVHLFTATLMTVTLGLLVLRLSTKLVGWMPRVLAVAMLGGLAAALVQHKGWSYHVVPVWMWGGLLCGLTMARAADALLPARTARRAAPLLATGTAVALSLLVMRGGEAPWREFAYHTAPVGRLTEWLEQKAPGGRLMVLSPDIYPAYPALNYAGNQPVLRFMSTWLLQAIYASCPADGARFHAPAQMSPAERYLFEGVAQDISETRPKVVLVARDPLMPWCAGQPFDMIAYFNRHPRFAAEWRHYRQAGEIDGYMLFEREE